MNDPFETFTSSAFRLETRPRYDVAEEAEARRAFAEGLPLPVTSELREWFGWLHQRRAAGMRVGRVHVVDQPLSEYQRYELAAYALGAREGEEIWIALRSADQALEDLREDFWLFDGDTDHPAAMHIRYDDADRFVGADVITDAPTLARYREQQALALAHALRLEEFVTLTRD
jgi:hypothetical protein